VAQIGSVTSDGPAPLLGEKKLFLAAMVKANLPKLGRKVLGNIFLEDPINTFGSQNLNLLPGDFATPSVTANNLFWNITKKICTTFGVSCPWGIKKFVKYFSPKHMSEKRLECPKKA